MGMRNMKNPRAGPGYNAPHKGGRKAKVPRQSTSGKRRPQRAKGRR